MAANIFEAHLSQNFEFVSENAEWDMLICFQVVEIMYHHLYHDRGEDVRETTPDFQ